MGRNLSRARTRAHPRNRRTNHVANENRVAFSIAEVMALTGLGRDSLYHSIGEGKLVVRKHGRRSLVLRDDLQRFIDNLPRLTTH
jgi:hypothetical protein